MEKVTSERGKVPKKAARASYRKGEYSSAVARKHSRGISSQRNAGQKEKSQTQKASAHVLFNSGANASVASANVSSATTYLPETSTGLHNVSRSVGDFIGHATKAFHEQFSHPSSRPQGLVAAEGGDSGSNKVDDSKAAEEVSENRQHTLTKLGLGTAEDEQTSQKRHPWNVPNALRPYDYTPYEGSRDSPTLNGLGSHRHRWTQSRAGTGPSDSVDVVAKNWTGELILENIEDSFPHKDALITPLMEKIFRRVWLEHPQFKQLIFKLPNNENWSKPYSERLAQLGFVEGNSNSFRVTPWIINRDGLKKILLNEGYDLKLEKITLKEL